MKKGFALLETIIVITFLCVSLLMLYKTFSSMISNSKKNILYDNPSNIYKAYYMKEYLLSDLININTNDINEVTCENLKSGCNILKNKLNINKMYIAKYDLKNYHKENYSSFLNNYLASLSNKGEDKYRFIIEIAENNTFSFASIGINGVDYE